MNTTATADDRDDRRGKINPACITIRLREGTRPAVERVYAFDPHTGAALVLLRWSDGGCALDRVDVPELEALDALGFFTDVSEALSAKAENLIVRA